jgi:ribonuclease HII
MRDSKTLTPKARETLAKRLPDLEKAGARFVLAQVSAHDIDQFGVAHALRTAVAECLALLALSPDSCRVLLDGGLHAPSEYKNQSTIIRGDAQEVAIATASVCAKVARDAHMVVLDAEYPMYGFAKHKGYGTKAHSEAIRIHGLSPEHRRSFCGGLCRGV